MQLKELHDHISCFQAWKWNTGFNLTIYRHKLLLALMLIELLEKLGMLDIQPIEVQYKTTEMFRKDIA